MAELKGRILLYYHHFGGLGHGTRILSICKELKQINSCEVVVINSGKKQPELRIQEYARVINLPSFSADSGLFTGLRSDDGVRLTFKKRSNILNKVRDIFKPDVAVFEHYPFGRHLLSCEINSFISLLRNDGCRIYSSVRDIIDQAVNVEELHKSAKLFDGILVHSDKDMGFMTSFQQLDEIREKIFFTGRVVSRQKKDLLDQEQVRKQFCLAGKKWIVIGVGGGIDGERIIERLIKIKKLLDKKCRCSFLVLTGPNISSLKYKKLQRHAKRQSGVQIVQFDSNYLDYVNAADLSISMGGYNSINNALVTGARTMIFPRMSDGEQQKRAQYFNRYAEWVEESISDEDLIDRMCVCINRPRVSYFEPMLGAQVTARLIEVACHLESLKIRVASQCNLSCDMCSWKKENAILSADIIQRAVVQARIIGVKMVNLTGGEPTLLSGITGILEYIKANGLRVSLSTNGCLEPLKLKKIIPFLDHVDISLDSYNSNIHDRIRGRVGAFRKTVSTIKLLARANIRPYINVTVRPDNYKGLHQVIPMLAGDIDQISFGLVDGDKSKVKKYVFTQKQLKEFYFDELMLILKECIGRNIRLRVSPFFSELMDERARDVLIHFLFKRDDYVDRFRSIFSPSNQRCLLPKRQMRIDVNGNVGSCCFLDGSGDFLGNIIREDLCNIVVSDRYFHFVHNAVEGRGKCYMCKSGFDKNYGDRRFNA